MSIEKAITIKTTARSILTNRNALILIIATIGMLPELISYGEYFIDGDIAHQMLPFVYETKRMFGSGTPFWSWNTYFGDNFYASYAYYTVFNPFTWINCLFPYRYLGVGFTIVLYLKLLVCGYVSQEYLKKLGFTERLSLIGCLLYTFSSWAITNLIFYMFLEPMILFPFLLIFIERLLKKEKFRYSGLAGAVFVVTVVNYYFAASNLIAGTIYFFCRLLHLHKETRDRYLMTVKAAGCVLIGMISASIVLIPVIIQLDGSPHESFNFDSSNFGVVADRIFWLIYPKAHEGRFFYAILDSRWNSNTASISVFGLLPLLLIFTKKGHKWIKWLTTLFVIIYITPLNGLFSLFTDCYYSRWAYALTLAIIISTLYYIKEYGMPRYRYALYYCVVIYGFYFLFVGYSVYWQLHIGWNWISESVTRLLMDFGLIVMNAISLLLLCRNRKGGSPRYSAIIICVGLCTAVHFFIYSIPAVMKNSPKGIVSSETDYFRQDLDHRVQGDFEYRTNFSVSNGGGRPCANFGLICNRPSINTYHSIQNSKIQKWINIVGDQVDPRRVFCPRRFEDSFEALMSVKDHIVVMNEYTDTLPEEPPTARDDAFYIYQNRHFIPMGFSYDKYVTSDAVEAAIQKDDGFDTPLLLLSALMIDESDERELAPFLSPGRIDENVSLDSVVNARRAITCDSFRGHSKGLDAHIDIDTTRVVFFSVLADDGFKAYIDGKQTKIFETNFGFSSLIVPAGSHDITFRYFPPGLKLGMVLSLFGWIITTILFLKNL